MKENFFLLFSISFVLITFSSVVSSSQQQNQKLIPHKSVPTKPKSTVPAKKVIPVKKTPQNVEMKITFMPQKEIEAMLKKITEQVSQQFNKTSLVPLFVNIQDPIKPTILPNICCI